jgi:L-galactose dehydrogenase
VPWCTEGRQVEYRRLGQTGLEISALSFGASSLGSEFREIDEAEGIRTVHLALDMGINFIDVAPYYGRTRAETVLGKALQGIPRDSYLLETKVGRYDRDQFDFTAERVKASVEESLTRLGVDYLDIVHCHDIEFGDLDQIVDETLPALRQLQEQGKTQFVGVTGLPLQIFRYVLERADLDATLSYCHYALNDTSLAGLIPYLKERDVGIINASPLSMRLLTDRGPPEWHPAPGQVKQACARAAMFCRERGVDIAQLAIQFSLSNPDIATTLVSTADPANIEKDIRWAEAPLDQELLVNVLRILMPIHNRTWPSGRPENN